MKTKTLFIIRCYPKITINRLSKLTGTGTAYITESLRKSGIRCSSNGYQEIKDDQLAEYAEKGCDIVYRTASWGGAHRILAKAN